VDSPSVYLNLKFICKNNRSTIYRVTTNTTRQPGAEFWSSTAHGTPFSRLPVALPCLGDWRLETRGGARPLRPRRHWQKLRCSRRASGGWARARARHPSDRRGRVGQTSQDACSTGEEQRPRARLGFSSDRPRVAAECSSPFHGRTARARCCWLAAQPGAGKDDPTSPRRPACQALRIVSCTRVFIGVHRPQCQNSYARLQFSSASM
jgi:hypothetical protein